MSSLKIPAAFVALTLCSAIFGFFYAWVCSTMWGLDAAPPRVAIVAMQEMNASVRNPVFALSFFGTPIALAVAALCAYAARARLSAGFFSAAVVLYLIGCVGVTATVNVPLNRALAATPVPEEAAAEDVWRGYSEPWQRWNAVRAATAGVCVLLVGGALISLRSPE